MPSEEEIIISFIFKRSGKKQMEQSEFYLSVSMDLKWLTPSDAKKFLNTVVKKQLLKKKGSFLEPSFDYEKTSIPLGFKPSKDMLSFNEEEISEIETNVLEKIIKKISEETKKEEKEIENMITKQAIEKNIIPEVAAVIIAKEYGLVFDDLFEEIENKIFIGNIE